MFTALLFGSVDSGGTPAYAVNVTAQSVQMVTLTPTAATASYRLGTDGIAYRISVGGIPNDIAGQWLNPADATQADLYECRATLVSGSLSAGSTGSWLALTSDRTWSRTQSSVGTSTCVLTIEIRLIATPGVILSTATITLTATVESGA